MRVNDVYEFNNERNTELTLPTPGRLGVPGWGSWLPFSIIGLCVAAWAWHEHIVVWLLSEGMVEESATHTLPDVVRYIAVGAGIASTIAAWRIFMWSALGFYRWGPVATGNYYLMKALRPMVKPLWVPVAGTSVALLGVFKWLFAQVRLGISSVAQILGGVYSSLWRAGSTALGYVTETLLGTLGSFQRGVSAVIRPIILGIGYLGLRASTMVQSDGRTLGFLFTSVVTALAACLWLFAQPIHVVLRRVRMGVSKVGSYLSPPVVARAFGLLLRPMWLGTSTIVGYLQSCFSVITGYMRSGVSTTAQVVRVAQCHLVTGGYTIVRPLRLGFSLVTQAVGQMLSYLKACGYAIGRPVRLGVNCLAQGVASVLRYVRSGVVGVADFLRLGGAKVLGYLQWVLSTVGRAVSFVLQYTRMATFSVLKSLQIGFSAIAGYLGLRVSTAAQFSGTGLFYLMRSGYVALRSVRLGTYFVTQGVSSFLSYVGRGATTAIGFLRQGGDKALGYLLKGFSAVAQAVGLVLRYTWKGTSSGISGLRLGVATVVGHAKLGVSAVVGYLGLGVSTTAQVFGTLLHYLMLGGYIVVTPLLLGTYFIGKIFALLLRHLGLSALTVAGFCWLGVSTVVQGMSWAFNCLWTGVSTLFVYQWRCVSAVAHVVSLVLRPLWLGSAGILRHLLLGASTAALSLGWVLGYIWQGLSVIFQGLIRSPFLVTRTVWSGCTVVPDLWKAGVRMTKQGKEGFRMAEFNLTRERLLSLVVTVLVFFTIGSAMVRILWPAPPEPTVKVVHWATGHLMREGEDVRLLPVMAEQFNKAGHRNEADKRIVVEVHNVPSELQAEYLVTRVKSGTRIDLHEMTDGYVDRKTSDSDPAIVTPSSAHWLVSANYDVSPVLNGPLVDLGAAKSIVSPVIGIVTHEEMARCLGWPDREIGYADIMALRNSPEGWTSYPCANLQWGDKPLVAFTDPTTSSTGRSLHLALYSFASGKRPEDLTLEDVNDPKVVSYVEQFQGLIDHYLIGTTVLNTKIYQGPGYGHFFIMPEDNLIHLYEGTESAFINGKKVRPGPIAERGLRMVMIYPKEGSMPRSNCACVVHADWVSGEQAEAAQKWIDFIREDEQQRSFMAAGFRPGTDISLTDPSSKINSRYGLDPTKPAKPDESLNPSLIDPAVAAAIDESWEFVKRPAIVTLVVDTSGSMMGDKLKQAKDGAIRFVDNMAMNNQVGLVTFGDTIKTQIPVAPLMENRFKIAAAVQEMRARGETALYDAIKAGVELTDAAEGDGDAIRAVIVLTDGRANRCSTHLDDIIRMEANERQIQKISGCEDDPSVVDEDGMSVSKQDVVGTDLAIETNDGHDIQIFFIGIGEDADMDVGRVLAQATGAEFQGVAEDDLANLLAKFSGYF